MSTSTAVALTPSQQAVLNLFTNIGSIGYTFEELEASSLKGRFSPSRLRSAVAELRRAGLVTSSGENSTSHFGRRTTIWVVA